MSRSFRNFLVFLGLAALALVLWLYIRDYRGRVVSNGNLTDYAADESGNLYIIESGKLYWMKASQAGSILGGGRRELAISNPDRFISRTGPVVLLGNSPRKVYLLDTKYGAGYKEIGEFPSAAMSESFCASESDSPMVARLQDYYVGDASTYFRKANLEVIDFSGNIRQYEISEPSSFMKNQYALSADGQHFVFLTESEYRADTSRSLNVLDLDNRQTRSVEILDDGGDAFITVNEGRIAVTKMARGVMVFDLELNLLMESRLNCSWFPPFEDQGAFLVIENVKAIVGLDINGNQVMNEPLAGTIEDYIISGGSLYICVRGDDSRRRYFRVDAVNRRLVTVSDLRQDYVRYLYSGALISGGRMFISDIGGKLRSIAMSE
ncbi:hypothetical protein KDL30_03365 [bacterium]|nr:hypothetical protein [bacterium]